MNFSIGIYPFPMDPMDSIGTTFYPLIRRGQIFLSLSRIEMNFSIGIYPFPMDLMDSIRTTLHPLIQHE